MVDGKRFFATARERYMMKLRREDPTWPAEVLTEDYILQNFRFCNVFREDDKVTTWFRENVREPHAGRSRISFECALFRFFNTISTGEILLRAGLFDAWDGDDAREVLKDQRPLITGAYMIKTPLRKPKLEGLIEILDPIWDGHHEIDYVAATFGTLQSVHEFLLGYRWVGPFMAYQIVSDLRFTDVLSDAEDINTWASLGPGSARGVGRVLYEDPNRLTAGNPRHEKIALGAMQELLELSRSEEYWPEQWPEWEMSTVQHWLCEFDKYERTRLGEGTPKQRYEWKPEKRN